MSFYNKGRWLLVPVIVVSFAAAAWAQADPVAVEVRYQNGVKYFNRGLYDRAAAEFERALEMDPSYGEAQAYLDKINARADKKGSAGETDHGEQGVQELTAEAKKLYAQKDFEAALEVFNKILAQKPLDDYANYYKERCEIFISRKLARERKIEEKALARQRAEEARQASQEAKVRKAQEREEMLSKRKEIDRERREARRAKASAAPVVLEPASAPESAVQAEEAPPQQPSIGVEEALLQAEALVSGGEKQDQVFVDETPAVVDKKDERAAAAQRKKALKEEERQQRLQAQEAARQEKMRRAEERRQQKQAAREEKAAAKQQHREEKQADSRWNAVDSTMKKQEKALAKEEVKKGRQEEAMVRSSVRDLYLQGVEYYAEKDYPRAVESFQAVVEAERHARPVYTGAAQRMTQKAKKRQAIAQEKLTKKSDK